jgi:hypothetical protein
MISAEYYDPAGEERPGANLEDDVDRSNIIFLL